MYFNPYHLYRHKKPILINRKGFLIRYVMDEGAISIYNTPYQTLQPQLFVEGF
jgi:hypothetical protein